MTKLQLPDVTLVMVETREHALARMAIEDCLRAVEFGDVLILTDDPSVFVPHCWGGDWRGEWLFHTVPFMPSGGTQSVRFHRIPDFPDKLGWCRAMWHDVPPLIRTKQTLNIQWDSWIWDASMWRDEFLNYDFVGAPWWYDDGKNVGNSGFCLKSTRLARYISDRRAAFPCDTSAEDDLLCRKYRPKLEDAGFRWAPEKVAYDFAYEGCGPNALPPTKHFGFHAMFNWPRVLDHERLLDRVTVALNSPYIRDSYIAKSFCQMHPAIVEELVGRAKAA